MTGNACGWKRAGSHRSTACIVLWLALAGLAWPHPADQSAMRVTVRRDHFEMRLTLNLLTVAKLVRVDADADGLLSHAEITRAQEPLAACLREHLLLEVNQKKAEWNPEFRCELLWPDPSSTTPMSFEQYEGRNLDITLTARGAPLLQDFWIGFNIFELTGPLQTIQGVYEQEGRVLEVPFSVEEPEFT